MYSYCSGYGDLSWNLLRYVSTNPIPHVQCQNKGKHLYMRDRMTNFWVTKSAPQKFFSDNFLSSFKSTGLRAAFQPFTKVVLKKFVAAAATKGALDSSSKRDKGFVIVCVTFTHTHTICHGASAATTSRKYEPISPDKTYTSEGWAVQGSLGRHSLRCMTKNKNHDSLAQEYPASKHSQWVLISFYYCGVLAACCCQCLDPAAG